MKRRFVRYDLTREEIIATAKIAPVARYARYLDLAVEIVNTFPSCLVVWPNYVKAEINCDRNDTNAWHEALVKAYIEAAGCKMGWRRFGAWPLVNPSSGRLRKRGPIPTYGPTGELQCADYWERQGFPEQSGQPLIARPSGKKE
jgi:hypothetical protein